MFDDGSLSRVKREIEKEAQRCGFVLAFRSKDPHEPIGFSLFACQVRRVAAIHGVAKRVGDRFELTARHQPRYDSDCRFTKIYLEMFAGMMGVDYAELLNDLSARNMLWRFRGYIDGGFNVYNQDNDDIWQPLWRELQSLVKQKPALGRLPQWATSLLFDGLSHAAVEGQVVLDK
jgi:hypothetical protein